jgi:hypothetical protein
MLYYLDATRQLFKTIQIQDYTFYKMHFIKHCHRLMDETLFVVQVLANKLVILSLLQFKILLTLSHYSPPSVLKFATNFLLFFLKTQEKVPFSLVCQEFFFVKNTPVF